MLKAAIYSCDCCSLARVKASLLLVFFSFVQMLVSDESPQWQAKLLIHAWVFESVVMVSSVFLFESVEK